jgi:hypothetical protein
VSNFQLVNVPSVIPRFLEACPAFQSRWDHHVAHWHGEPAGDYNDVAELAHFVVDAYARGDTSCLSAIFQLTEELLQSGHPKQKEIVTLGFLEDIQTISSHHDFGADGFISYLGPLSRDAWERIASMWEGKQSLMDVLRAEAQRENPPKV